MDNSGPQRKLRVLYVITSLTSGGAEAMILKLAGQFRDKGIDLRVVTLKAGGFYEAKLQSLGIEITNIGLCRSIGSLTRLVKLARLLKEYDPDVVHTWLYHSDLIAGLVAKALSSRAIVWSIRQADVSFKLNKFSTYIVIRICGLLSRVIPCAIVSCSERAIETHKAIGYPSGRICLIPNGFDLRKLRHDVDSATAKSRLGFSSSQVTIGHVGRLDSQKNQLGFVEMAERLVRTCPDAKFIMVGKGVERNANPLWSVITEKGLCNNFELLGERADIFLLMRAFDVLVSTSLGEAFPNVLGEAMGSEVPCVITDVGDSKRILGGYGFCVAAGDIEGLSARVHEIITMPRERRDSLVKKGRERVEQEYNITVVADIYASFYRRLGET